MANKLYIVLPCYNEHEVLPEASSQFKMKLDSLKASGKVDSGSKILFIDDGSNDNTWEIIEKLHKDSPDSFSGLKLSRNRGHQNALLAGLLNAKDLCDFTISMDVDLQDDIDAIDAMVERYISGNQIVYGVRNDRSTDSVFKRNTAQMFYKFMNTFGVDLVYNHADFRLLSKNALEALSEFDEVNLFLRGIVPLIGFKSDVVTYHRKERFAGTTKYPLKKMLAFAWQGITSFSSKLFSIITFIGSLMFFIGLTLAIVGIVKTIKNINTDWILSSIWIVGGVQTIFIGLVGHYIGKINLETKKRPRYIVETFLD